MTMESSLQKCVVIDIRFTCRALPSLLTVRVSCLLSVKVRSKRLKTVLEGIQEEKYAQDNGGDDDWKSGGDNSNRSANKRKRL